MDSLTRYAQAQREIALAIGEPPATKGYPPSVFAKLPRLVERAGTGEGAGSITAFYTVLVEGDDQLDPIADAARAILDGHVVLSRTLAESGHFPAIDVESSISRLMHAITDQPQQLAARRLKGMLSLVNRNQDLINVGAYRPGSNPQLDEAITRKEEIMTFLRQDMHDCVPLSASVGQLLELMDTGEAGAE
jgi:flagellum-specific ATP synthase